MTCIAQGQSPLPPFETWPKSKPTFHCLLPWSAKLTVKSCVNWSPNHCQNLRWTLWTLVMEWMNYPFKVGTFPTLLKGTFLTFTTAWEHLYGVKPFQSWPLVSVCYYKDGLFLLFRRNCQVRIRFPQSLKTRDSLQRGTWANHAAAVLIIERGTYEISRNFYELLAVLHRAKFRENKLQLHLFLEVWGSLAI